MSISFMTNWIFPCITLLPRQLIVPAPGVVSLVNPYVLAVVKRMG
jgi:hypothetical protein